MSPRSSRQGDDPEIVQSGQVLARPGRLLVTTTSARSRGIALGADEVREPESRITTPSSGQLGDHPLGDHQLVLVLLGVPGGQRLLERRRRAAAPHRRGPGAAAPRRSSTSRSRRTVSLVTPSCSLIWATLARRPSSPSSSSVMARCRSGMVHRYALLDRTTHSSTRASGARQHKPNGHSNDWLVRWLDSGNSGALSVRQSNAFGDQSHSDSARSRLPPPSESDDRVHAIPHQAPRPQRPIGLVAAVAATGLGLSFALALSGCAGFGNLGNEPGVTTVTLASVNNPQMQDMAQLLPEFNKSHPDIKINMIFMEENDLRNAATKDVATKGGQYDIMTVGAYEVPIWGQNRWLVDLTDLAAQDPAYDVDDFFKPVRDGVSYDDRLYAVPFYGESSFLMYRKDLFAAGRASPCPSGRPGTRSPSIADEAQGPARPWRGSACAAKPGWGEMFAPLTTVVNTFGGQWYDMNWHAQVNQPGFEDAVQFYIDTLTASGEGDPVSFGFTECLNLFSQERAAMWYDATSAAGSVEARRTRRSPARSATSGRRSRRPRTRAGCGRGTSASTPSPRHKDAGLGVPQVGDVEGLRQARRLAARLVEDPAGHAQVDL